MIFATPFFIIISVKNLERDWNSIETHIFIYFFHNLFGDFKKKKYLCNVADTLR